MQAFKVFIYLLLIREEAASSEQGSASAILFF